MRLMRLMGLIGLIGFMSCSSDGVEPAVDPQEPPVTGTPITFSGERSEEQAVTRMSGDEAHKMRKAPLSESVQSFQVWGFKNMSCDDKSNNNPSDDEYGGLQMVFPGYTVRWTANSAATSITNSNGWEYINQQPLGDEEQTIKYWDWSAVAYRFFGVAGATEISNVTGKLNTEGDAYTLTYKVDATDEANIPYYSHLWFSTGSQDYPDKQFGQPVVLEFIKPLSKVRFMFIFEEPDKAAETELTDKEFRPSDGSIIRQEGNVTVSYPLTGTSTTETFATSSEAGGLTELTQDYYAKSDIVKEEEGTENEIVISPYLNADESTTGYIYTVLPTPAGQSAYTMTVGVDGEPKTAIVPAQFMTWLPGYQYTYIFKIHIDGSVTIDSVQSAFTEWKNQTMPHPVYNW